MNLSLLRSSSAPAAFPAEAVPPEPVWEPSPVVAAGPAARVVAEEAMPQPATEEPQLLPGPPS